MQEHIAGPSFFKGVTINAKMRLDHELLSSPEPHILKWLGYILPSSSTCPLYFLVLKFYANLKKEVR
ncbi:hypothetical protein CJF42_03720 [Pseudoalteromonas sp. NBT06-2]|nr:hypothetical protein CJF42_03720 [Pseudoalteromonas sp. NBT06-2]